MVRALIEGETDPATLAELAQGSLQRKKEELGRALKGRIKPHHRLLLQELVDHIEYMERSIGRLSEEIERRLRPFDPAIERLDAIVGVNRRTIEDVLAEIGTDMTRFPDAQHLASWAGLCPGNNESAGKRLSGRIRK